jgi:hypothetical protein
MAFSGAAVSRTDFPEREDREHVRAIPDRITASFKLTTFLDPSSVTDYRGNG